MEYFFVKAFHILKKIDKIKIVFAELVKDVVLSGNLFTTLLNIEGVGNDLKMIESGGGCGKAGQNPLPVSFGSPHLRIKKVVVGGR